ncbi:MAG: hypothetical protein ACERKZ_07745 [Lachnotalea sp.]
MMYGRGFYGSGYSSDYSSARGCIGYGYMNNGWSIIIGIGILLTIALLIYILVHNKKKVITNQATSQEVLKMKYVQGEITEEEYLKRKNIIE